MKLEVLREFNDAREGVLREVGETFEATRERFEEINSAGYGDLVADATPKRGGKGRASGKE